MLTKLEVLGLRSLVPTLPLTEDGDAGNDPVQVLGINGLGPVKANIVTSPYGAFDGEALSGMSVPKRNIVLTIGLHPDWSVQTIEELRQLLYNYFMPKLLVQLRFHSDNFPTAKIEGYVESMEPNIFVKSPTIEVSIVCPSPDFVALEPTVLTGITGSSDDVTEFSYSGSVETGFYLKIEEAVPTSGEGSIQLMLSGEYAPQSFTASGLLDDNVRFELNTVPGQKYVRSVDSTLGTITNYLNDVAYDAIWPTLFPGVNRLAVITAVPGQNWELSYYARFGGL